MTGASPEVLEYLRAEAAMRRAIADVREAVLTLERIRLQWEPLLGTPEGSRLAAEYGKTHRFVDRAMERSDIAKERWEAARDRTSTFQVVDEVKRMQPIGNA